MTDYIHHTNRVIDRASGRLPRSWGNVSGLDRASPEELKSYGWLPVVEDKPAFDPATERLTGPTGVSVGDSVPARATDVTAVWTVIPYTPPVPVSVTPIQARRALRAAGHLVAITAWVATQSEEVQETWEYAVVIRRDDPLVAQAATALRLSSDEMDDLFHDAVKL